MNRAEQTLEAFLDKRRNDKSIRTLTDKSHLVDFCSNDYLGLGQSVLLRDKIKVELAKHTQHSFGATGSRLISGNHPFYTELETYIASYHKADAGLMFNSGYDANVGFFSAVPQKGDLIIFDELVHASIRDGIKLSRGNHVVFRHNDLVDLEEKLTMQAANKYVVVESLFSMDGDFSPLVELVNLCEKYDANLVVDEAHATGIFGPKGEGRIVELGLEKRCFARVHTFGKALGCHGAIVLGSEILKQFLINFSRSFIYTTSLPFHSLISIKCAYDIMSIGDDRLFKMSSLCGLFDNLIEEHSCGNIVANDGPIRSLLIPGNDVALKVAVALENAGFYAKAILYPTVPRGKERIRICLHSFNTDVQIKGLVQAIKSALSV